MHEYKNMTQNKAAILPLSELSTFFNQSISMTSKGPLNPAFETNHYFFVTVDHFGNYIVIILTLKKLSLPCERKN